MESRLTASSSTPQLGRLLDGCGASVRFACFRILGVRAHVSEQDQDEDGHAQHEGGARDGRQVQSLGKRLSGGVEEARAEPIR
jgi:hypothetical protein